METAASCVDIGVIEALRGKDLLLAVIAVGNETVETLEIVAQRLLRRCTTPTRSIVTLARTATCYPLSRQAAEGKLHALASSAALVNATL